MTLIQEKVAQAKQLLKEFDIDCWLTFVRESSLNGDPILAFLVTANVTWHSAFIVTSSGRTKAIVGSLDKATIDDLHAFDSVEGYVKSFKEPLQQFLREIQPRRIAVNYSTGSEVCDGITHGMYLTLMEVLAEIGMSDRVCSSEKIISALRQRKTADEITAMNEAIRLTLGIYDEVRKKIKPGVSEKQLAAFMQERVRALGVAFAWDEGTCPSVFTGPDTAGAHYGPTDRKVQEGHVLNMDFGLRVKGYCSDLQRTYYVARHGEKDVPAEVMKGFTVIRTSIEEARKKMRPGVQGMEIDAAARSVIVQAGFEEFPHALGHQVGRFAHDGTALLGPTWEKYARKPFELLEEGMVFTLEPRLTVPGYGVVTIEEMVQVTSDGAKYLSEPQVELYVIHS